MSLSSPVPGLPGSRTGRLVYSTCSIEPEENGQIVKRFLEENTGWQLETERTLHPVEDHTDGAYAARLTKD